jgi:sugar lactone lactonase YvrE
MDHDGSRTLTIEIETRPRVLADGFRFTECPRWRAGEGKLYFSDMHSHKVHRMDKAGTVETVCTLESNAGGIGFLPDGDLIVAAMPEGRILRLHAGELSEYANFSERTSAGINDMIVSAEGRCYVGRYFHPDPPVDEPLIIVDEQGGVRDGTDTLGVANGMVLTADGKRLIVAESAACRIAIFDLDAGGVPVNRRTFAQLPDGYYPDGICGDDRGGIWAACAMGPGVIRVVDGGEITHRLSYDDGRFAYACALGGRDGDTLFICTAGVFDPVAHVALGGAHIEALRVPFVQAGIP